MDLGDRVLERSERALAFEKERAIARIRGGLAAAGEEFCIDCEAPIPPERRAAMPSAERCIGCQGALERRGRRR